jgi:formate--tetrahydrofolate ligase
VRVALNEVFARGGEGGIDLANEVLALLAEGESRYAPIYDVALPVREKVATIARKVYGADGADFSARAERSIDYLESIGLGNTPIWWPRRNTRSPMTRRSRAAHRFHMTVNECIPRQARVRRGSGDRDHARIRKLAADAWP